MKSSHHHETCRTKTMFGHENSVPPKGSTRAEHHALIFFFLIFTYGCGCVVIVELSRAWIQIMDSKILSKVAHFSKPVETASKVLMHRDMKTRCQRTPNIQL
jgi:hypothetical protein